MADDKELAYANSIWDSHSTYFERMRSVRNVVRMDNAAAASIEVAGKMETFPPNGRALSIALQFRAFAQRNPKVRLTPKDNSEAEKKRAEDIERFLYGVPRAVSKKKKSPYPDMIFNGAEAGRHLLYTRFDETLALQGKFPICVEAVDPLSCALHMGKYGLISAVIKETYKAEALVHSLKTQYSDAESYGKDKPKWSIPAKLREQAEDDPLSDIETVTLLKEDYCYFWAMNEHVYDYAIYPHGCPVDVGFCIDLPSNLPEQWGLGLIYPVAGMLDAEWKLLNKETIAGLLYTAPFLVYKDGNGRVYARHLKPSNDPYGDDTGIEDYSIQTPNPNVALQELLLGKVEQSIERLTLAQVSFGEGSDTQSGYQVNLLSQPVQLRTEDQLAEAKAMWERQYARILSIIEYYANEEMAKEMGAKGADGVDKYLKSFATVALNMGDPYTKQSNRVYLSSNAVKGYDENDIDIELIPEPPADENAKGQRIQLYKEAGYPQEWIDKYVTKVPNQPELDTWRAEEMLMATTPAIVKFKAMEAWFQQLERDQKVKERWELYCEYNGLDPATGEPLQAEQPAAPTQEQLPPQDPSLMLPPPDQMAMMQAQQGLMPDTMGLPPQMLPPAEMGMMPVDPMQAQIQGTFGG